MIKMKQPTTFEEGFEAFLEDKRLEGCRDITLKHYQNSIHVFLLYFDKDMLMEDIENYTVQLFFSRLQERNISERTVHTYMRSLRTVLYFFMDQGWMDSFRIKMPKVTKTLKEIYTDEELKLLLRKPNVRKCSFAEYRDWAVINYIMGTGQRLSTVINIQNGDIDLDNGMVYLRHMKNRKQVVLPLTESLVRVLREYVKIREGGKDDYLFCTVHGKQLTSSALISSIRHYNQNRGVEKTSIHLLRHTFAVKWIRESGDIAKLQRMLTHSDLSTTQLYLDLVYDDLKESLSQNNPLESLKRGTQLITIE